LSVPTALGAVATLGVLKGAAGLLTLAALVLGGAWLGFDAGTEQVGALSQRLAGLLHLAWLLPLLAVGVLAAVSALTVWRRRRGKRLPDWRQLRRPAAELARSPRRLLVLLGCSAAMTLTLGLAFAATTAVFGGHASVGVGGLLIAYMLGGAAGNASLLPGGIGATEAALSALLVADHVPASQALQIAICFRVLTFWLPAALGLLAARHLARRRAL
jgi:undecaprenyl-diphosphatase